MVNLSHGAVFVLLAPTHGVIARGCSLVAWFGGLAAAARVVVANVVTMGPAVIHVFVTLLGGVFGVEVITLLEPFLWSCVVSGGCPVFVGDVLDLFSEFLDFFGLVCHLGH